MDWKRIAALAVLAVVVTAPFTGGWYLTRPVTASVNGGVTFDCGTPLDPAPPSLGGQFLPMPEAAPACDDAVKRARSGGGAAIGVGVFSWVGIGLVLRRRRAGVSVAQPAKISQVSS